MAIPTVSVVLPMRNGERHVAPALRSILDQTFTDFECLLIDDGSTDAGVAAALEAAAGDPRLRLVSRANRGLVETLNEGVDLARGTWIARMDADDIASPQRLMRQLEQLRSSGADVCGTGVRYIGDARGERIYPDSDAAVRFRLLYDCALAHPTVIGRADVFRKHRYRPEVRGAEDYDLWSRLAREGVTFTNVPEPLLAYRIHAAQESATRRAEQARRSDEISRANILHAFDSGEFEHLRALLDSVWHHETVSLPRYGELLWRMAEARGMRDSHIDAFLCSTAAARSIPVLDALQLHRRVSHRGVATRSDRMKLLAAGLLGPRWMAWGKRMAAKAGRV